MHVDEVIVSITRSRSFETILKQFYRVIENWEPRGVEEAGCKIYSGALMVSQTMG